MRGAEAEAEAEAEVGWAWPFEMPGSAGTGAHARAAGVGSTAGFDGADSDKAAAAAAAAAAAGAAAALTQMTKVSRLSENFSMLAPGAPPEARAEYRRLLRLCRNRTNQLGVRQTVVDGDKESSSFGPIVATDGSQSLALAVRASAGSPQPGAATSSASAPASVARTGAARNSETIDPDSNAEFGTPRASFDHEPLGTTSDGVPPLLRQCFRWWKATPRFDGTAPAQLSDRVDQADTDGGVDTKDFQVYDELLAQRIEQAFTQYSEARGPPFFTHMMRSYAYGTVEEKIDFVDWTVTCSVTSGDRHLGAKAPLRPSSGQLGPASSNSCVVSLRREVDGVPLCTEEVDSVPVDNQQEQQEQQEQRTQETVADGLKLWCRLNENGELETIPGACKDGYGGLDNNEFGSSGMDHEAPHFLVAVQLGKRDWGVRLLPQRDDGTVGCAAHLRWECRNDRLYSLAISDQLVRNARASGTQLSAERLAEVEVLPLEIHAPHAFGSENAPTPVPVRWTRGHQEDERKPTGGVLRLAPKRASKPSSASGNPAFHQSDKTASSTSSTISLAATAPQDSALSVLDRWSVKDENDGEQVLRANVRLLWRSTDYIAHRRVICVPPTSHIKAAALEVWDDPNSTSCRERCSAIQAVVAEQAYSEQPLSDTAEILAKRAHFLVQVGRHRQAEKLYRTAVAELLQRIGPHRTITTASAEKTHRRSSSLGSSTPGLATTMHPSKRALYDAVRERRSELGAVNAFIGNAQAAAQRRYGVSWVNRAAELELQQATVKADASADAQERCELLHRGLLACVEHDWPDQVRRDERRRAGSDTNSEGSGGRKRQISNSFLEDAKDNQDTLLADKVTEREPLVLRKNIEIWEFKKQEHDSLAIFAHPVTGVPYLGDACKFTVEEPKEFKEMQEREQSCRNLNFSHVRKVDIGPVRCDKHGYCYITLNWMDQDNTGWEKLLKTLYWLTLATEDAATDGTMSRSDVSDLDAATATEMIVNDTLLCDATKVSFTVPPAEAGDNGSFHLRVRFGQRNQWLGQGWTWEEDNETQPDGWFNPLTHRDGYFFSPKFRRADMAKTVLPPPVVLDDEWENSHIDAQLARPESTPDAAVSACASERPADGRAYRAGSLRIFTLSGLQASTTSMLAKKGLGYGESMVEIQYARVRDRDTGNVLCWEDAVRDEGLWSRALEYRVPEAPILTVIVNKAVDMMRHKGIPMIEAALMSHFGQNKKKNTKVLKDFLEELWEKQLEPVYNYKIEPWLANKTLLRLLVTDTRGNALREATRNILRGLKVEIPPHLQRDRPCFETITIQLLDKYGEPSDTVLRWRHEDETREHNSMFKRSDEIGVGGASAQRKHERARGDVPVLEVSIPSGSRFLVTASLGPSPWAYARQHWDPSSALVGVDSKTRMQNMEEQARDQRQSVGTKAAKTRGPSVSTVTALPFRNTPSAVVQSTPNATLMSKDNVMDLNPHAADQRDVIISGIFMRRKHAWLSGSPKRYFVQLLRRNRSALIDKDLMVGAGSTCKCTGGAFVLSPGSKGISSGKTYTFTPVVDVTMDTTGLSTSSATPESVARLWAERLNEFITNDEKHPKTDYSLILRVTKPDSSSSPDVAGKSRSAFADSARSSLNENDLELTQQRSRSRAASMNNATLSDVAQITRSSPSLGLEPHNAARDSRTREECVRLAANYVHHHQLPDAIELVLHYMQLPRASTPVSTPTVATGSVTSVVGGTTAFVNQVLGAIEELEDTDTHRLTAKPMATACQALGQLLSTDPYNPQILRLLESLHAALMQHPSTQRKQQRRTGAGRSASAHWATEPPGGPQGPTGVGKQTRLNFDDGESGPASSDDDSGGEAQFGSPIVDAVFNNEIEDELLEQASSVRHAGTLGFHNELIGEQDDPQVAYDRRNPHRNLQIWWRISASPDELLDLNDSSLLDRRAMGESKLQSLPGGRLHVRDSLNDPETRSVTSTAGKLRHATLRFRGTHKESDFACLSPGTEFTLQCQGLEEGAHELSELDIHIKVVQSLSAAADQRAGADEYTNGGSASTPVGSKPQAEQKSAEQKQTKPKWPPVPLARPPSVTELVFQVRTTAEQALLQRLHRMYSYLDVPKIVRDDGQLGWGSSLKDSPSLHVVRTATERFLYQQIIARLSKELPRSWRVDPKRVEQWRARHQQKLQAEGVGSADMADLPLMTEAVGEVIKLRMVEWWQKSLSRYRSKQRATPAERREALEGKRNFISRLLEDDSSAEARNVNVDLDAISEAETMDVLILVLKRVIKEEVTCVLAYPILCVCQSSASLGLCGLFPI